MTSLVLCMAGLYRRFREAGYTTPKFLLTVQGRTILSIIVDALDPKSLVLVANECDRCHEAAIRDAVGRCRLLWVGDTGGQAETAAIGARAVEGDGPIVFHNVDTILYDRDLGQIGRILTESDGFIDVFDAYADAEAFLKPEYADPGVHMHNGKHLHEYLSGLGWGGLLNGDAA